MSFMKPLVGPLAGAAVGAIPGVGPILGPIAGAAVSGAMTSSPNSSALGPTGQGMQAGYNLSNTMAGLAGKSFNPVIDYWSRILSGNRGAAMSALSPEIARMGDQNTAEMRAASELMPRTGGRATLMQQMPFQQMRGVQSLFQSQRPQAATQMGNMGNTLMSNSINALNAGTSAGRDIMDYQLRKQLADRQLGGQLGGQMADAVDTGGLTKLLQGIFAKKPVQGDTGYGTPGYPGTPPFVNTGKIA
jgi:hypothetical protein